jgi:hypothetical protein
MHVWSNCIVSCSVEFLPPLNEDHPRFRHRVTIPRGQPNSNGEFQLDIRFPASISAIASLFIGRKRKRPDAQIVTPPFFLDVSS